jgi:hypothetical protein
VVRDRLAGLASTRDQHPPQPLGPASSRWALPTRHVGAVTDTTPRGARIAWWIGLAGHLVALVWYAASGLVAPAWALACLLAVWVGVLVVAVRLRTRRPLWTLLVPVADIAVWFAAISAGDAFLDWTA